MQRGMAGLNTGESPGIHRVECGQGKTEFAGCIFRVSSEITFMLQQPPLREQQRDEQQAAHDDSLANCGGLSDRIYHQTRMLARAAVFKQGEYGIAGVTLI